ncbi:hypothetical protein J5N97_027305 [Dioscorea zingiberensis]|uniref:Uncharacterized protein n=1 Tax=Dioscorea zingiberensis TaxID=325984 RepID=A0A9D5H7M7_9LILI|nr:hypothetical protein J5N97_027305 [Dioscorea zingiberensis]
MPAMSRRLRRGSSDVDDRFHRFLRPGALARIRDSRIIARSQRSGGGGSLTVEILPLLPPSPPSPPLNQMDGPPCFAVRVYGPRFPQRKKLAASKYFFFPAPSGSASPEADDQILDFFSGVDLVSAH